MARNPVDSDLYMTISPGTVRAGERIEIAAQCYAPNSTATSDAFGTVTLRGVEGADIATVTLRRGLRPGTYRVVIRCGDGRTGTVTFVVTGPPKQPVPAGAPQTGGGGTDSDPHGGQLAGELLGAVLLAAGCGAGLVRWRRGRDAAVA
jgi:hypothetical protein